MRKKYFHLSFKNYLLLLKFSFTNPNFYIQKIPVAANLKQSFAFFFINILLGLTLGLLIKTAAYGDLGLLFYTISQFIVLLPFYFILLLLTCSVFHSIAKVLGGKGSFSESISSVSYSTSPLVLFWIPLFGIFATFLTLYILAINLTRVHQYPKAYAIVTVLLPITILIIIASILGLFNFSFLFTIFDTLQNFFS